MLRQTQSSAKLLFALASLHIVFAVESAFQDAPNLQSYDITN
jgi:hypothetical protein